MVRELLPLHDIQGELSVMNQYLGPAFDQPLQGFAFEREAANHTVHDGERGCGEDAARDRVIAAIHRVLDGIAEDQQQDQIKRRELTHLAFAGDAQDNDDAVYNYSQLWLTTPNDT